MQLGSVAKLAARHLFVPYKSMASAKTSVGSPPKPIITLNDGTKLTLKERMASDQLNDKSSDVFKDYLDRAARLRVNPGQSTVAGTVRLWRAPQVEHRACEINRRFDGEANLGWVGGCLRQDTTSPLSVVVRRSCWCTVSAATRTSGVWSWTACKSDFRLILIDLVGSGSSDPRAGCGQVRVAIRLRRRHPGNCR